VSDDDFIERWRGALQDVELGIGMVCDALLATLDRLYERGQASQQAIEDGVAAMSDALLGEDEEEWIGRSHLFAKATLFRRQLLKGGSLKPDEFKALADLLKQLREQLPPDEDYQQSLHWGCPAEQLTPGEQWCIARS
jgi:hypothetical protein